MTDCNYPSSRDGHGLSYPGFSVIFIQTFNINHHLTFEMPDVNKIVQTPGDGIESEEKTIDTAAYYLLRKEMEKKFKETSIWEEIADYKQLPIVRMARIIENQIFVLPNKEMDESERKVQRFSLRGFDFEMPIEPEEEGDFYPVTLKGHANVEMSLFFGNTVSLTYRFFFDGKTASILCDPKLSGSKTPAVITDHIITLLSVYLGAEHWSEEKCGQNNAEKPSSMTDINLETNFYVSDFWFGEDGEYLQEARSFNLSGKGRTFDLISLYYKKFIYNHCTSKSSRVSKNEYKRYLSFRQANPLTVHRDTHYAMVDIWENVKHILPDGSDLFDKKRKEKLSEAEIVNHIRDHHKEELIGLLSMYPGEWPYRDAEAYEEVCGGNIAIDTDDLVLVGSNLCVVLGTYGRRGAEDEKKDKKKDKRKNVADNGVNWAKHLVERAKYHVSWPEYLLILQMVLAKKCTIERANDQLVHSTLRSSNQSSIQLIGENAELSRNLSHDVLELNVIKYSKFPSHVVMFKRTTERLGLEADMQKFNEMIALVDSSLHNLSDYKAAKSDFLLNMVLLFISCMSTFELFFQQTEMPFLEYIGVPTRGIAATLVFIVSAITIFAILLALRALIRHVGDLKKTLK